MTCEKNKYKSTVINHVKTDYTDQSKIPCMLTAQKESETVHGEVKRGNKVIYDLK